MYTKQDLASLGKQASDSYIQHGIPLTESIVKLASSRPDLTKEHVQRVVENANLLTFEELFKSSSDKHVTFDLADPDEIRSQIDEEQSLETSPAYLSPPTRDYDISGWEPEEKVASVVPDHVRWRRDFYATKGAVEHLVKEAHTASAKAEATMHNFVNMLKKAAYVNGLKPTLQLAGYASTDKSVFDKVAHTVVKAMPPMTKEGSYTESIPNKEHPIYVAYANLEEQIKTAHKLRSALINAERYHQSVLSENFV
tara:strand:+ start:1655 stop:2416 length:762 start_codon:yes stop_codon:yes gene_type:complete